MEVADFAIVLSRDEWSRVERKLSTIGAHGKIINIMQLIITYAKDNPDLQLEVIRQRLSISRNAMRKYATLLGILSEDSVEEQVAVTDAGLLEDTLRPLVASGKPIPVTKLAQQHGVSVSHVYDSMKALMEQLEKSE